MAKDLTPFARAGYQGKPNINPDSSSGAMAHSLGAWLQRTGRSAPYDVTRERGQRYAANGMLFTPDFRTAHGWERLQ